MRNSNAVEPTISAVPISLYRELCSELQEKNGEVNALQLKNQRILDENQQLRQELQRLVQMVMQTHHQVSQIPSAESRSSVSDESEQSYPVYPTTPQALSSQEGTLNPKAPTPQRIALKPTHSLQANRQRLAPVAKQGSPVQMPDREEWLTGTHQPLAQRLFQQGTTMAQELRGWRLALVISLIILSAFGAGFLIVRPLMNSHNSHR
jgi:hypothetical protein